MVAHATPRTVALYTETAFVTGGSSDLSSEGTFFYCIEPDVSGVVQATADNENYRLRPWAFHDNIRTLRNSQFSFGLYCHGSSTNAAEEAAATSYHLAELLRSALGGRDLGYAAAVESSGTEEADEIEVTTDPGFAVGDWVFYKQDGGAAQFYRITAITAGSPAVLTVDRDVHVAVVDRSEDDTLHAVIDCYIHQAAATQHDHASHTTMQFLAQGDHAEDVYEMKGCKPTVTIEPITAGEPTRLSFEVLVTTFAMDDASKEDFGNATPVGEAGAVPGIGTGTLFLMADYGSPLATVPARGSITVNPGVTYERVMGPNGHEGVHGHVASPEVPTLEVMVDFDNAYNAAFRAGTKKHALIQVGSDVGAWGIYMPRMELGGEPVRADEGGLTTSALSFRGLENAASPGSLTGDDLEKFRTPFHILLVA